jgi:sugar phosphate isomerase/epimerase
MRLGGKIYEQCDNPESWIAAVQSAGWRAAYCPLAPEADDAEVDAYARAAAKADVVIAEVGSWCNTISADDAERTKNIEKCRRHLDLAERIGARCCVNIAGSRGEKHNGPHPDNLSPETFDLIVEVVRAIVDAVKPTRSAYTLEMMGWCHPSSAETYLDLIDAVDRPGFGVHLDPVNLVNSPDRYYDNAGLLRDTIRLLGPHIRSCHAKDVILDARHLVHLDECRPGTGWLDYRTFLHELDRLDDDLQLMLEHLPDADEYAAAAKYIRTVADEEGVTV